MERMKQLIGRIFWDFYQFLGRNNAPNFTLNLTDGLAEYFLDGQSLVYCIHHCWHCPEYYTCPIHKGQELASK